MRYYRRWESKESHMCKTVQSCQSCYSSYNGCKEEEGFFQECTACSVHFRNKECFVRHLTKKVFKTSWGNFETPCAHMFFCDTCYKKVPRKNIHFLPHPSDTHCDISAVIETVECCGYRQYVFEKNNDDIVDDLVNFMFEQPKNSVWIAHNGGRFDTVFLLHELLVKCKIVPKVIMNGNKIMCMELEERNLKVIDSFLFLSMKLSNFPKALGIKDLAKGYHPYHFTDLSYTGPMIGLEYFDPPSEGTKERKQFDEWYNNQKDKPYIFKEAIYYYCRLDVDILRQGCIIFARLIKNITGVFPFYDKTCHTIVGLALKIYRSNFLNKDIIGQIPAEGYGGNVNQSTIALYWLRNIEGELSENGMTLQSKLSVGGEQRILNKHVDGYCEENHTINQFHGCFFHGCTECYEEDTLNPVINETFYTLRDRTRRTTRLFKTHGYKVVEMWECDFLRENKITQTLQKTLRQHDFLLM